MIEVWKTIPDFQAYEVSNFGRVRSKQRRIRFVDKTGRERWRVKEEKIIATQKQNGGYIIAHLHIDNVRKARTVHSLVATTFLGPRPQGSDVCHNDGNRTNNGLTNLRYATRKENQKDRLEHGTFYASATQAKLTPRQIKRIRALKGVFTQVVLAKKYNVHYKTINKILNGKTWVHI